RTAPTRHELPPGRIGPGTLVLVLRGGDAVTQCGEGSDFGDIVEQELPDPETSGNSGGGAGNRPRLHGAKRSAGVAMSGARSRATPCSEVEAPGIEPALRASGNPLRNATLPRRCPESFGRVGPRRPTWYRAVPSRGAEAGHIGGTGDGAWGG